MSINSGRETLHQLLKVAIDWGLDPDREAYRRLSQKIRDQSALYKQEHLEELRLQKTAQVEEAVAVFLNAHGPIDDIFDETPTPETLWRQMVSLTGPLFDKKADADPLVFLVTSLASIEAGQPPIQIAVHFDGWGI